MKYKIGDSEFEPFELTIAIEDVVDLATLTYILEQGYRLGDPEVVEEIIKELKRRA